MHSPPLPRHPPATSVPPRPRVAWVDLLKGFAGLVMIEAHVSNLLTDAIRRTTGYAVEDFINGIVAPTFLFTTGGLFLLVLRRRLDEFLKFGPAFWRRLRRIGAILALGYMLHLPYLSLVKTLTGSTPTDIANFFQVDVLQCNAAAMLILVILLLVFRKWERFVWAAGAFTALFFFAAPLAWNNLPRLPLAIIGYFNGTAGSFFPLFPFGGFVLAGALVGYLFDRARSAGREGRFMLGLVAAGAALILAGTILDVPLRSLFDRWHWRHYYWSAPTWFGIKFGIVFLLAGGFWLWTRTVSAEGRVQGRAGSFPTLVLATTGSESLLAYASHIPLVFGSVLGPGIKGLVGTSLNWGGFALVSVAVMAFTVGLCWVWHEVKKFSPRLGFWLMGLFWAWLLVLFLIRPH